MRNTAVGDIASLGTKQLFIFKQQKEMLTKEKCEKTIKFAQNLNFKIKFIKLIFYF